MSSHSGFEALGLSLHREQVTNGWPGRYAWIVETPGGEKSGIWSDFVVE